MPVTIIDGREIGSGKRGLITKKLQDAFSAQIPKPLMGSSI
jgi:D-alanine transaminase